MNAIPLTLRMANDLVDNHHRHNKSTVGHRFSIGLMNEGELVGAAIVGRPIARKLDDGLTAEVLRLVVTDKAPRNACSFLYRCCCRAWSGMGGKKIITYTLQSESGASLKGAAFKNVASIKGGSWNCKSRKRETQNVQLQAKFRWEIEL